MKTAVKRLYEGLFLVDSALAASDWEMVLGTIRKFLDRAGAEIVSLKKWDDRRLAYEVEGKSRGTYLLAYFYCEPSRVSGIERDVNLSEVVLRVLILRADRMSREDMEKPTPAEQQPEGGLSSESGPVEAMSSTTEEDLAVESPEFGEEEDTSTSSSEGL